MKKKLVIDIDDVLRELTEAFISVYKKYYDKTSLITIKNITDFDFLRFFKKISFLSKEEFFKKHAEELFLYSKCNSEAISFLEYAKDKYDIIIASNQLKGLEYLSCKWLNNNNILYNSLMFTKDKKNLGDILIDDNLINLKEFNKQAICFDRPWNKKFNGNRIYSLLEFKKYEVPL